MRILYIDIDALRPDHLGCYGYHRKTSPTIDALANRGWRFDQCYCSDAPCLPSRTALYTGQLGIHTGVVNHGGEAADPWIQGPSRRFKTDLDMATLPMALQRAGLHTAQISPFGQRHSARHFLSGFNEVHNTGGEGGESAPRVQPCALKWLADHGAEKNWYLHLNYWDVHTPYRVPESYGEPFAGDPLPAWLTEEVFEAHRKAVGPHSAQEIHLYTDQVPDHWPRQPGRLDTRAHLRAMIDGYDTAIRYVDDHIAELMRKLEELGVAEETTIIVSADHGENQGELGIYGEHGTADAITCRVPLIVSSPGLGSGKDCNLRYQLDLAPTLLDMIGRQDLTPASWDGQSFHGVFGGDQQAGARDTLVVSQCAHVCQRGVRFGPWMFIRTYHDGFHLFPENMLFHLENDPHEQQDIARQHPEICREALARLTEWHDDAMRSSTSAIDPLWTVMREGGPFHARGHLASYCERLKKTGRGVAVPELMLRHPREFA